MEKENIASDARGDENRYLKRFESEFHAILNEITMYSSVIPQYKDENASLRERIANIRGWAEAASKVRYQSGADVDAVLANLITQILLESDKMDELKPVTPKPVDKKNISEDLYQLLTTSRNVAMDEAFQGFDFYDNNPHKKEAERKIQKIQKRKKKK